MHLSSLSSAHCVSFLLPISGILFLSSSIFNKSTRKGDADQDETQYNLRHVSLLHLSEQWIRKFLSTRSMEVSPLLWCTVTICSVTFSRWMRQEEEATCKQLKIQMTKRMRRLHHVFIGCLFTSPDRWPVKQMKMSQIFLTSIEWSVELWWFDTMIRFQDKTICQSCQGWIYSIFLAA